jgi:methyl-accepting chemotaxis protein
MVNGETGFGFYHWNGENRFGSYTPVKNTNGWSVNVTASESEFMSGVLTSMLNAVILGAVSLILAVFDNASDYGPDHEANRTGG